MRPATDRLWRIALTVGLAAVVGAMLGGCSDDGTTPSSEEPEEVEATGAPTATAAVQPTSAAVEPPAPLVPLPTSQAAAPPVPKSFETCSGFLELEEIRRIAGRTDISLAPRNVNSGPQEPNDAGIEILCVIEYITPERPAEGAPGTVAGEAMTVSAMAFDSAKNAKAHFRLLMQRTETMRERIGSDWDLISGTDSYLLRVDAQGVGSVTGSLLGPYIIGITATLPRSAVPIVTTEDLQALVRSVTADLGAGE